MVYRITIDVTRLELPYLRGIAARGGTISKIVPDGPGGGNPELTIDFDSRGAALDILWAHYDTTEDADWVESQIREIPTTCPVCGSPVEGVIEL